jgi:membrane-bound lytic murein transglycosylase D
LHPFLLTEFAASGLPDTVNSTGPTVQNDSVRQALIEDSPIVQALDSLAEIKYFRDYYFTTDTAFLNVYKFPFEAIPQYPDSVLKMRIDSLDQLTPIELTFNDDVRNWINLYAVKRRELTSRVLGLAEVYFPLFEEILDKYNLPLELKYLAIVESALNPTAGSRAGAKGLWQFMYNTGKIYGLKVTSYVDDRFDPYKSTDAACRHLRDLYEIYEDWLLVLAAYNSGAGNVNKAMRRAGNIKSYWAIQPFLPRETRGYVPAFISVNYIMNYNQAHNLYPIHPGILYNGIDTVVVRDILSFDQISEMLGVSLEDLTFLNPAYKLGVLPSVGHEPYVLRLPKEYIGPFIANEQSIYQYKTQKGLEHDKLIAEVKKVKEAKYHTVRSGENLGLIARKYNCSINDLKKWNGMKGTTIYPGQRLIVYVPSGSSSATAPVSAPPPVVVQKQEIQQEDPPQAEHIVKSGETLAIIAGKYGCSVKDLQEWNNLNSTLIHPNQKLLVMQPAVEANNSEATNSSENIQAEAQTNFLIHTVKSGETLWDIAQMYQDVTVDKIKEWNNISNAKGLQVGQKLKIAVYKP